MEVIARDEKEGGVKLRVNNLDDLWVLKNLVSPGDAVRGKTYRREETAQDMGRSKRGERKPVTLTVEIEDVEFHKPSERLRLLGIVRYGDEDASGSHHTINVDVGKEIWIFKREGWREDQLERLEEAETKGPDVGILTIEEGEAFYGLVRQFGIDKTFTVKGGSGKRREKPGRREFFGDVAESLARTMETQELDAVVVAGPGFTKEDFMDFFEERYQEEAEKVFVETCSGAGPGGVQEVIRRGAVERAGRESRLAEESSAVENLLEEIAKEGGEATYGEEQVERALEFGAVDTLLITEGTLMESEEWGEKMEEAKGQGGSYLVLSSEYEPGQKVEALGGVAALLKFPIT